MDGNRLQVTPCVAHYFEMRDKLKKTQKAMNLLSTKETVLRLKVNAICKETMENWKEILEIFDFVYISLSAAKYFNSNFSKLVLEDVPKSADIQIVKKSIGVSLYNLELIENGPKPNPLLGLSAGGSQIHDAKINFKDLVTLLVKQAELRNNFITLDDNLKSTSRKVNVLNKMLIPKIENTCKYILDEIEDMDREDHFRIKKVKAAKKKDLEVVHPRAFSHSKRFTIQLLDDMCHPLKDLLQQLAITTNSHNEQNESEKEYDEIKEESVELKQEHVEIKKEHTALNDEDEHKFCVMIFLTCTIMIGAIIVNYIFKIRLFSL